MQSKKMSSYIYSLQSSATWSYNFFIFIFFLAFFCWWYTPWEFSGHENNVFHVWLPLWLFISEWGLSLVCCQHSQQKRWEKHTKHLARDQGANNCGLTCTTIGGFPKGSVWLGAIWLNPVLRNPQPTPSACNAQVCSACQARTSIQHHCSSVNHGFLFSPPSFPLFHFAAIQYGCPNKENLAVQIQLGLERERSAEEASAVEKAAKALWGGSPWHLSTRGPSARGRLGFIGK